MSALLTMRTYEATGYASVAAATVEKSRSVAKNIALFLAAPFIGLFYLLATPVVGFAALVWICGKALAAKVPALKTVALLIVAPFIGLVFIVAMPVAGPVALVWIGTRSQKAR